MIWGMTGVKYNFSNMVFQLVDGKLPYNIIKNQHGKISKEMYFLSPTTYR